MQAVRLPQPLQVLGNAAFYNCRKLEQLSFGPQVRSVGSDLFTNCHQLTRFVMRSAPEAPTGLPPLLGALQTDLRLTFAPNGTVLAALRYPEYWEELEENAPAHIFNRGIHGQGYRYRQCFTRGVVDYTAYDRTFEVALAEEDPTMLAELAFDRLRWPVALTEEARGQYTAYLAEHAFLAAGRLIREEDDGWKSPGRPRFCWPTSGPPLPQRKRAIRSTEPNQTPPHPCAAGKEARNAQNRIPDPMAGPDGPGSAGGDPQRAVSAPALS